VGDPRHIVIIPGDGIGQEVVPAVVAVLRRLLPDARIVAAEAGFGAYERHGTPLPDATLAACRGADAILFGAVTTPPDIPNYRSPILQLRQALDLAANLRPVRSLPIPASRPGVDLLIVRENTEGMYSGIEEVSDDPPGHHRRGIPPGRAHRVPPRAGASGALHHRPQGERAPADGRLVPARGPRGRGGVPRGHGR